METGHRLFAVDIWERYGNWTPSVCCGYLGNVMATGHRLFAVDVWGTLRKLDNHRKGLFSQRAVGTVTYYHLQRQEGVN